MSAAEALQAAQNAGVEIGIDGDDLVLEASAPPPAAVLEALSQHKADVVRMLRLAKDAAQALIAARAVGIHLEVDRDDLLLEASAPPPTAVLEALSQHKADVVRMLRLAKDVWSAEDWQLPMECDQCGKSTGTVQQAWICDPGGQPITARLHRECEAAFLQQLEPSWDFIGSSRWMP
jgi:hypothetical protein